MWDITVEVRLLPPEPEGKLQEIHQALVRAVGSVAGSGVETENDLMCLFPPDLMSYGVGSEIPVTVTTDLSESAIEDYDALTVAVGAALKGCYPKATIVVKLVHIDVLSESIIT